MLVIICILLALSAPAAPEQDDVDRAQEMSEEQVVRRALEHNPDLAVALHELEAERTKIQQAREFPATSVDLDFDQQLDLLSSDEIYYGITQEFEFPTRPGLRSRLAAAEVGAAEKDFDLTRWEATLEVRGLYQSLALAQGLLANRSENQSIANRLLQMAEEKYRVGSVGRLDVLRAGVEAATAANAVLEMEEIERALRMQLNYLIGREPDEPLLTSELSLGRMPPGTVAQLVARAMSTRLELGALEGRRSAASIAQALARSEYYPDFAIGVARHYIWGESDSWDITASISIPIFGRGAIGGRVAEAEALEKGLNAAIAASRARITLQVRKAWRDAQQLAERVGRYRDQILTQAEEAFRIAQASYREGESGSLELLDSQRTLQEVRSSYLETVYAFNVSLIELERAVGAPLDPAGRAAPRASSDTGGQR